MEIGEFEESKILQFEVPFKLKCNEGHISEYSKISDINEKSVATDRAGSIFENKKSDFQCQQDIRKHIEKQPSIDEIGVWIREAESLLTRCCDEARIEHFNKHINTTETAGKPIEQMEKAKQYLRDLVDYKFAFQQKSG
jgi:hypothetical protein